MQANAERIAVQRKPGKVVNFAKNTFGKAAGLAKDTNMAFTVFFRKGTGIKTMEDIAEHMRVKGWANNKKAIDYETAVYEAQGGSDFRHYSRYKTYAKLSFHIFSRAYEKIGKMHAEAGEYLAASEAYSKANKAHGWALTSGYGDGKTSYQRDGTVKIDRKERRLFGLMCYYSGKHEATASLEKSILAKSRSDQGMVLTREHVISFAAALTEQASGAFAKGEDIERAIKAGLEAAGLFAHVGENGKALEICDRVAVYAKENNETFELISVYRLAAEITPDKERANIYREFEKSAREEWLLEVKNNARYAMMQSGGESYPHWQLI